jgi:glucose/arabinose dehydrogenase
MKQLRTWPRYALGPVCLLLALGLTRPGVRVAEGTAERSFDGRPVASGAHAPHSSSSAWATLPGGFTQEVIASGLDVATVIAPLPDGRILIAEKAGVVRVYKNGVVLGTPLLDIRERVNNHHDRGLLGMAVDPDFARNGFFYLLYVYENDPNDPSGPKTGRLARYTAVGDVASPSSEQVLLGTAVGRSCKDFPAGADCIPADSPSHSVGNLKFAPDGSLFASLGDAAHWNYVDPDALRSQDLDSLAGKLLRISPDGAGLPTNPYWNGSANANRSKVWSLGLRNPFRFNLRPGSGIPYVGDVGWNRDEEINVATAGANFGWPCYEGTERQSGYEPFAECQALYALGPSAVKQPLYSWPHNNDSTSVTGGAFYTGASYPADYHGAYFFGDYVRGRLYFLKVDEQDNLLSVSEFAMGVDGVVDIEIGPDTNLYYLAITHGELRRIRYAGDNAPPVAVASATPTSGGVPLSVQFSSAGTSDPDGDSLQYTWDFGDGSPLEHVPHPSHTYVQAGTYTARLTVEDGHGNSSLAVVTLGVGNYAPTATIHSPDPALPFRVGDVISFSGSGTDPEDGSLSGTSLAWSILLHHCTASGACHPHPYYSGTGAGGSFTVPDHGDEYFFEFRFTATDSNGLSDTRGVTIRPQTVRLTLDTSPSGLQVVYNGLAGTTPFTRTAVVGSTNMLYAPSPQGEFTFESWSDGGDIQHPVMAGTADATYLATFAHTGPIECPPGELRAEYFNNRDLAGTPSRVRCEPSPINYDWGEDAPPDTGLGPDEFSVRWTGRIYFSSGFYRFTSVADDGVRLWVDGGDPLIDAWVDQAPTTYRSYLYLPRGEHEVTLEYYEAGGGAVCQLRWTRLW